MKSSPLELVSGTDIVSRALRMIRRKRGLRAADVAQKMGMPLRTYEQFEAGGGRISVDRIKLFAEVTDSDPFALLLGVLFGLPDFALHCADSKLATILMMHLEEFASDRGGDIAYLDPPAIITGFDYVFRQLGTKLDDNEAFLSKWLEERTGSIGLGTLRLRGVKRRRSGKS